MRKISLVLAILFFVVGTFPGVASAASVSEHQVWGKDSDSFTRFVNRGHVDILVVGDGSSDLDLYVYVGDYVYRSDGPIDDEKVCLSNITRSGSIRILVVNRGRNSNKYQLIIK